jgi:hypothetical protein
VKLLWLNGVAGSEGIRNLAAKHAQSPLRDYQPSTKEWVRESIPALRLTPELLPSRHVRAAATGVSGDLGFDADNVIFFGQFPDCEFPTLWATGKHVARMDDLLAVATFRNVETFATSILSCFHNPLLADVSHAYAFRIPQLILSCAVVLSVVSLHPNSGIPD